MNKINRNNYEQYFLDYLEGEMSFSDRNELMLFLELNPDLKEEMDSFEQFPVNKEIEIFNNKQLLKKEDSFGNKGEDNFDDLCVAKIEGDLTEKQALEFDSFIKDNIIRQKEYKIYELTKLKPDNSIVYKQKQNLKKGKRFNLYSRYGVISIAASVAVLIGFYLFMPKNVTETEHAMQISESIVKTNDVKILEDEVKVEDIHVDNIKVVKVRNIAQNKISNKVKLEPILKFENDLDGEQIKIKEQNIAYLDPIQIKLPSRELEKQIVFAKSFYMINEFVDENDNTNYFSVKTYLVAALNKRVFRKRGKENIELFDIAQAGVKGINKITGTNMSLERGYNEKGEVDKTVFNSRLIAFSTPVKKN